LYKFYSVDAKHGHCGECCMNPDRYKIYHIFEPNLKAAPKGVNDPCSLIPSGVPGKGNYSVYNTTVTHGGGGIKMTLDLYNPAPQ